MWLCLSVWLRLAVTYGLTTVVRNRIVRPLTSIVAFSPSIDISLCGPVQASSCILQTNTSDPIIKSCILSTRGPLRWRSVSLTWRVACIFESSCIAFLIALARCVITGEGGSESESRGYAPNTRRVGISPFGPAVSLTAFTVSCNIKTLFAIELDSCKSSDITS